MREHCEWTGGMFSAMCPSAFERKPFIHYASVRTAVHIFPKLPSLPGDLYLPDKGIALVMIEILPQTYGPVQNASMLQVLPAPGQRVYVGAF